MNLTNAGGQEEEEKEEAQLLQTEKRLSLLPQVLSVYRCSKPSGSTAAELLRLEEKTVLMDHMATILAACACV